MLKKLGLPILVCLLIVTSIINLAPSAIASIHTYPETETQTMYRSALSVQDNQSQAWQLILFKRVQSGEVKDFKLRLVGFPGQVLIQHPTPLIVEDSHRNHWTAVDDTQNDSQLEPVLSSVGQYDVLNIIRDLDQAQRLELNLTLAHGERRTLIVSQSMVREWLSLKDSSD